MPNYQNLYHDIQTYPRFSYNLQGNEEIIGCVTCDYYTENPISLEKMGKSNKDAYDYLLSINRLPNPECPTEEENIDRICKCIQCEDCLRQYNLILHDPSKIKINPNREDCLVCWEMSEDIPECVLCLDGVCLKCKGSMLPLIHFYKETKPLFHHKKCDNCNEVTEDFTGFEHFLKTPHTGRDVYGTEVSDKLNLDIVTIVETCCCNFCSNYDSQFNFRKNIFVQNVINQ